MNANATPRGSRDRLASHGLLISGIRGQDASATLSASFAKLNGVRKKQLYIGPRQSDKSNNVESSQFLLLRSSVPMAKYRPTQLEYQNQILREKPCMILECGNTLPLSLAPARRGALRSYRREVGSEKNPSSLLFSLTPHVSPLTSH